MIGLNKNMVLYLIGKQWLLMKKTYVVTALVDFEVEAENERDAISNAELWMGDISSFHGKSVICYDDEELAISTKIQSC